MKKSKWLFVVVLMVLFTFNNSFSVHVHAEGVEDAKEIKHDDTFEYIETDDGIEIIGYLDISFIVTIPSEINNKPITKITYLCNSQMWGDNEYIQITIPDSVIFIEENALKGFVYVYANPNSYARKFADEHNIEFRCIEHTNIVIDPEIPPTCGKGGKKEGSHCGDCNFIIKKQENISPTGKHRWRKKVYNIQEMTEIYTCTVCGKIRKYFRAHLINDKLNVGDDYYKICCPAMSVSQKGTVNYMKTNGKKNNIVIPNSIIIGKYTYKVIGIEKNAFKNNKKIKKVTIEGNITSIGKNAFYGCKNLKTITIKSKNIKFVDKNVFKGINSKAKIKVPSSKLKKYKKLFKNKGQKSTVKIKKI